MSAKVIDDTKSLIPSQKRGFLIGRDKELWLDKNCPHKGQTSKWGQVRDLATVQNFIMPNPASLSDPNQDLATNTVNLSRISNRETLNENNINSLSASVLVDYSSSPDSGEVDDMRNHSGVSQKLREKISAMGVIASKQEPKTRIMNGSEHNNKQDKSPRGEAIVGPRDGPVLEVCAKSQLEVSPKQFLKITKLKAWIEKKATTVDETSPGVLKYKTPHFR